MSHILPNDPNNQGHPKQPADFTKEEKTHIARQILDCQRDNQHYGNRPVDRDALIKARLYAHEGGDTTIAGECEAALAAMPARAKQ